MRFIVARGLSPLARSASPSLGLAQCRLMSVLMCAPTEGGRPSRTPGPALLSSTLSAFQQHQDIAARTADYIDRSPDPFHATHNACTRLEAAGFTRLDERDAWAGGLAAGGKYYFTRNRSCVVAFAVGGAYVAGNGFKVIGAHTDSPNLRVKPRSARSGSGCLQLDVECYGGGLWHTWFDRDLSVSGRVMVRGAGGGVEQRLVKVERPLLRVPTLCIHLQTAEEREAFKASLAPRHTPRRAPRHTPRRASRVRAYP